MAKAISGYIQQLPSGAFRVSVYAGTDPLTGRQIRLRRTWKTERAAEIELAKLLEQTADGRRPDSCRPEGRCPSWLGGDVVARAQPGPVGPQ